MNNIKLSLIQFIDNEYIIDPNSYELVSDFMIKLEKVFKINNIILNKNQVKFIICSVLGEKLNINNYKSKVYMGKRIYLGIQFKNNVKIDINKNINDNILERIIKLEYEVNLLKEENFSIVDNPLYIDSLNLKND